MSDEVRVVGTSGTNTDMDTGTHIDDARVPELIDRDRLRAALRLCFSADQVDALVPLDAGAISGAHLDTVIDSAHRRYRRGRWLGRLPAVGLGHRKDAPLAPGSGLSATGALALSLHLGLDLDGIMLARLFDVTPEQLGSELAAARWTVGPKRPPPCRPLAPLLGRYRDPALSQSDRIMLLLHTRQCPACATAVEDAHGVDRRVLDWIGRARAGQSIPSRRSGRLAHRGRPALLALVMMLAALAVVAALNLDRFRSAPSGTMAPRTAAGPASHLTGWLLQSTRGTEVQAVDLATGTQRTLFEGGGHPLNQRLLSPDQRLLAVMANLSGQASGNALEVYALDGRLVRRWEWREGSRFSYLTAWGDDATLYLVQGPGYEQGATQEEALARQERESRLLALDVATGEERVLFQGSVTYALPSPDGSLVAIRQVWNPGSPGFTIELRPLLGGRLGEPVARTEQGYADGSEPIWSPDSSRLYLALISSESGASRPADAARPAPGSAAIDQVAIAALQRDGAVSVLTDTPPGELARILGVSPDGRQMVFATGAPSPGAAEAGTGSYWMIDTMGGAPRRLASADSRHVWRSRAIWSPDGRSLLLADPRPFFLPPADGLQGLGDVVATRLLTFDQAGNPLGVARSQLTSALVLGWLPSNAIPAEPEPRRFDPGDLPEPTEVSWPDGGYLLEPWSRFSPDGRRVLLAQPGRPNLTIWDVATSSTRPLAANIGDLSWFPDSAGLVGVVAASEGIGSRITTLSTLSITTATQTGESFDYRTFDPAGIGERSDRRYAAPRFSPSGVRLSFFVVDSSAANVTLWLAGWGEPPRAVASWELPAGARLEPALVAEWIDEDTLLFAVHREWRDGWPSQIALRRLTLGPNGATSIETLTTFRARGNERGIVLRELALSPDGGTLAVRLRHYTERVPDRGRFDTVRLGQTADFGRALELSRGGVDEGLSWSPDGAWLATVARGRLLLSTADGRESVIASPDDAMAANPLWRRPGELWLTLDRDSGPRVVRLASADARSRAGGGSVGGH